MAQLIQNGKTQTTPGDNTQHDVEIDKVQVNVFFDGTLNNYFNVKEATAEERAKFAKGSDNSYDNGLTNVARMWEPLGIGRESEDLGVYIEGMGTKQHKGDDKLGYVLGDGDTGVKDRARAAFEPIKSKVLKKRGTKGVPHFLELNVFGFSRGAATARHFVHLLGIQGELDHYFDLEWRDVQVLVNFVGLFDTVSSYGLSLDGKFEGGLFTRSNVDELGLRLGADVAKRVVHLYALDEYRKYFSLTNIDSACMATTEIDGVRVPMGFEMGLPGAHADVGGSYTCDFNQPVKEKRDLPPTRSELRSVGRGETKEVTQPGPQAFAYAQGWYTPKHRVSADWHVREVTGDYYKVGLSTMVMLAKKYTGVSYPKKLSANALQPDVQQVQAQVQALVNENAFLPGKPTRVDWSLDQQWPAERAQAFRSQFLHVSFRHGQAGYEARFKDDTVLGRYEAQG